MRVPHFTQQLLLALQLLSCYLVQAQSTYSIADLSIYEIQKACVRRTLNDLPYMVDCSGMYNECICRDDTYQLAYSALSSAIPDVCSNNAVDMTSAVFVYTEYCNSAMGRIGPLPATVTPITHTSYSDDYPTPTSDYYTPTSYASATAVDSMSRTNSGILYTGPTFTGSGSSGAPHVHIHRPCLLAWMLGIFSVTVLGLGVML